MPDLQAAMSNPAAFFGNKMMTRLGLKRSREFQYSGDQNSSKKQTRVEEIKVEKTRIEEIKVEKTREGEIKGEGEKEDEKIISDWMQKEWITKKNIKSTEGKTEWCKYTVMKRRTGSLLDLAEKKGAFFRQKQDWGIRGREPKQSQVKKPGRTRSRSDGSLLKELLKWNHRKAERDFMDHDGLNMQ